METDEKIFCPSCGAPNIGNPVECIVCHIPIPQEVQPTTDEPVTGAPITQVASVPTCMNCGKPHYAGQRFCRGCGHQVATASPQPMMQAPTSPQPVAQRPTHCVNPQCAKPLKPNKKFCTLCGTRIT